MYRVALPATDGSESTEPLRITCEVVDSTGARTTSTASVNVRATSAVQQLPALRIQPSYIQDDAVVIGYCDFDKDDFSTTNPDGIRRVKEALAAGKRVTLIASCDELGDATYNDALMERRARNAVRLLGTRATDVTIARQPSSDGSNTTPMQRIANRSVRAVIK
jgi:outer membrane protein OmpA-like peptidoglycan-associated protein